MFRRFFIPLLFHQIPFRFILKKNTDRQKMTEIRIEKITFDNIVVIAD